MTRARTLARPARGAAGLLALVAGASANAASGELMRLDLVGTIFFVGCPYSGMCSPYPLMWGTSGGASMTLRAIYDPEPPIKADYSEVDYYYAEYDHAIPLEPQLGMSVSFGPYAANVGSGGAPADRYWISLFDVISPYPNFPDLQEYISLHITVPPGSVTLPAPPGFHDLELRGINYSLRNYGGRDFLDGTAIPPRFPELDWGEVVLTVEVRDPIYGQNGLAFLRIDSLTLTEIPSVPSLSIAGAAVLAVALSLAARGHLPRAA